MRLGRAMSPNDQKGSLLERKGATRFSALWKGASTHLGMRT